MINKRSQPDEKKSLVCDFATTNEQRTSARLKKKKQACDAPTTNKQ